MDRLSHFLDGFLPAFDLFPGRPLIEVRFDRRSEEEVVRDDWLEVGRCIRAALDEARDEPRGAEWQRGRG